MNVESYGPWRNHHYRTPQMCWVERRISYASIKSWKFSCYQCIELAKRHRLVYNMSSSQAVVMKCDRNCCYTKDFEIKFDWCACMVRVDTCPQLLLFYSEAMLTCIIHHSIPLNELYHVIVSALQILDECGELWSLAQSPHEWNCRVLHIKFDWCACMVRVYTCPQLLFWSSVEIY